ncbi:tryptophan synthase subunit alpha [candidate division WOR-1 bacterium RIFOXYA12_FULL_52_29]|uniref:Tryptophan synthase alpha chain n=1 Tax=candidate division WOR-1 bacterium RIFOXYC12_FULL_54_18 TaxID=1802584 RepID=A0A1F4T7L1_UNCSA|nr:MAG: tryptophan synthase subunit alpha [candidate division WOR-1 bacterium RIFOXYA2_FULL_51_19]OGC18120.1 MAG: tryptophan synthase subunit alpha [candidate division WOR-1 bacterium RIFOXYA12_FULL_52_29]OGC26975.1 MAG: tryptophan synthase subunit alpha [candidate division WOR-1 bacterium RIFOXYB2_FULL_45_9]OGC28537.1 MAG: tryptophan synthase subunit alpha [candidate division WOR-1 bacterium RIFOXYC12_FULL_54_18]OGC31008.1 MAG: tryptophan synthase subunit alpha [candidate division WOR-1 bacter
MLKRAFAQKALIAYITAGDPSLAATEKLVYALEKAGADIIELGIPFSDPLADGPIIQASHQRALKNGVALPDVFKLVGKLRRRTSVPICFMLSYNLVLQYGLERFYAECRRSGVNGAIVPDLPPEEMKISDDQVGSIFLVAPTSTDGRIKLATEKATGFIYLVSVAGVTGQRRELSGDLGELVARIKHQTELPVAIGFGISSPKQAAEAARVADGVIVGSAIVDLIGRKKSAAAVKLIAAMRKALDAL